MKRPKKAFVNELIEEEVKVDAEVVETSEEEASREEDKQEDMSADVADGLADEEKAKVIADHVIEISTSPTPNPTVCCVFCTLLSFL